MGAYAGGPGPLAKTPRVAGSRPGAAKEPQSVLASTQKLSLALQALRKARARWQLVGRGPRQIIL